LLFWEKFKFFFCFKINTNNLQSLQRVNIQPQVEATEEEPLYVNAKQYNRILKRRAARAKLENDGRIPKNRKVRYFVGN
jgi:hypothetical protein